MKIAGITFWPWVSGLTSIASYYNFALKPHPSPLLRAEEMPAHLPALPTGYTMAIVESQEIIS